jgi:hypothetical protein
MAPGHSVYAEISSDRTPLEPISTCKLQNLFLLHSIHDRCIQFYREQYYHDTAGIYRMMLSKIQHTNINLCKDT